MTRVKLRIEIDLSNDAFEANWTQEVVGILTEHLHRINRPRDATHLIDINGNTCGYAELIEDTREKPNA